MIRHITRIGLIIIVFAILIVIVLDHSANDEPKQVTNLSTHASQVQLKDRVPSIYKNIDFFIDTERTSTYSIDILKPLTNSESINNEIGTWIETEKQTFIDNLQEDSETHASFKIDITIEPESKHYNRFIFHIHTEKSPDEKVQRERVFNVDLEDGKLLSLDDFLDVNDQIRQAILKHALDLLKVDENITIDKNAQQHILTSINDLDWFMNQEGLTFIFDDKSLTESRKSPLHATIPFQALYLHMNENINHYIQLSDKQQKEKKAAIEEEEQRILAAEREQERKAQEKAEAKRKQSQGVNDPKGKYVALTFDDGPSAEVTPRILKILEQYDAKATFFMLGSQIDYHPEIAKLVADAGHEIGNHTEQHQDLTKLHPDGIRKEINSTSDKIANATGIRPYLVRPPYGAYNENVKNVVAKNGDSIILWSVDSLDWQSRNATAINHEIQQQLKSGAIVLMHDIHPTTADALPELMKRLHQDGYQFVTVSQLLKLQGQSGVGPIYGSVK